MTITDKQDDRESPSDLLSDSAFIADLRRQMVKFAQLQLGDGHSAEDAVQEALIGAMEGLKNFGGRAALKTWVFAILKNKIADLLRQKQRMVNASSLLREDEEDEDLSELFDRKGFWLQGERPVPWGEPEDSFTNQQFWVVFETCLNGLPPQQAKLFMMREFVGLETNEICTAAGITINNLFVMLHRARLRLRGCLENRWYKREE